MKKLLIFLITLIALTAFGNTVYAQDPTDYNYRPPGCENTYVVDANCVQRRLLNPSYVCQVNICPNEQGEEPPEEVAKLITIFGQNLYVYSSNKVAALVNMLLIGVMTVMTVIAFIYGVFVAAVQRSKSTEAGEIETANKTLLRLILGFVLAWSIIVVMQFVFSILGIGGLTDITISNDENQDSIIISPTNNNNL